MTEKERIKAKEDCDIQNIVLLLHSFNTWNQSQQDLKGEILWGGEGGKVLVSFKVTLSINEEILPSLLLPPAQTCVVKHIGDLIKTRLLKKKKVGFNLHQFSNLLRYAATQTPTLVKMGRRKLLPATAVLADSVNET